jgi:hypothetical protein
MLRAADAILFLGEFLEFSRLEGPMAASSLYLATRN